MDYNLELYIETNTFLTNTAFCQDGWLEPLKQNQSVAKMFAMYQVKILKKILKTVSGNTGEVEAEELLTDYQPHWISELQFQQRAWFQKNKLRWVEEDI